ncbi:hypothetical protein ACRB8A_15250 [Arthrobacter sp. G.S.26]|uniref:hypothetical protein n=1 Tax=Arthrobacter sp. G.S.26 TaxID=3433706 RepID=UPI003D7720AB
MDSQSPTSAEALELLARAESLGRSATRTAGWPAAVTFTSLAILGSLLMVGFHIVATTGYGAPLLAGSIGVWAAVISCIIPIFQRSAKTGFTRRFLTSLFGFFFLYVLAIVVGVVRFSDGNLAYYMSAAVALAGFGLSQALRELRS